MSAFCPYPCKYGPEVQEQEAIPTTGAAIGDVPRYVTGMILLSWAPPGSMESGNVQELLMIHAGISFLGRSAFWKVARKIGYTVKTMTNTLTPP